MMARTLVTAPVGEPIDLDDIKNHLNIEVTADDGLIEDYITAARIHVENITNRALITQTWDVFLDMFPEVIELPKSPLQSVSSISYVDTNGDSQTLSSAVYTVDTDSDPGRVYLAYQQTWPTIRSIRNAITVRFIAGYGAASTIPQPIKQAIMLLVGHMYENRESTAEFSLTEVPMAVKSLLAPYKVY